MHANAESWDKLTSKEHSLLARAALALSVLFKSVTLSPLAANCCSMAALDWAVARLAVASAARERATLFILNNEQY
jgi:hypothetical protein